MFPKLKISSIVTTILSSSFLAFGLYEVHSLSGVTEGGVLGMTLLLDHWFGISPAFSGFLMNAACYLWGWKLLGKEFIAYSAIGAASFSGAYGFFEQFEPIYPQLYNMPLAAALIGAVFVGIGAGFCVRVGGAPSGDDALAMTISHITGWKIQQIYLISDLVVLGLSMSYIPVNRICYSLLTVLLSGQIIGIVCSWKIPARAPR